MFCLCSGARYAVTVATAGFSETYADPFTHRFVGMPDAVAGEVPVAVVQYASKFAYSDREIRNTVTSALGQPYSPQRVFQLSSLGLGQFPLTAAGKPDKKRLRTLVNDYVAKHDTDAHTPQVNGTADSHSTQQILTKIWAELSAQSPDEIAVDQSIADFADSLLVLQATSLIEKRTKKPITAEDVLAHPTIEQQAALLDRRARKVAPADRAESKTGPPSKSDIAHVRNDSAKYEETKAIVSKALSRFSLDWDNVEDVLPYYDNGRFMLESVRILMGKTLPTDGTVPTCPR